MIIIRFLLICLIVYLLVRGFMKSLFPEEKTPPPGFKDYPKPPRPNSQKVSKKIGEYVDYEEIKEKEKK
jgi:hypothetical protein